MAKEYIEREALLDAIINDCPDLIFYSKREAIECIVAEPAADVVEVAHGRYIPDQRYQGVGNCDLCGGIVTMLNNYCPNCGARMDGEC